MKKLLSFILVIILITTAYTVSASAREWWVDEYYYGKGPVYYLNYPTKNQILSKAREWGIDLSRMDSYAQPYSLTPGNYAPGQPDEETYSQALHMLNFYRYVAGLPYDVQLRDDYNEQGRRRACWSTPPTTC